MIPVADAAARNGRVAVRLPTSVITLTWDEGEMAGLEVVCSRGATLGDYFTILDLTSLQTPPDDFRTALDRFARIALRSWNVEDQDGNPVPADYSGLMALPADWVVAIFTRYTEAVSGVPNPAGIPE